VSFTPDGQRLLTVGVDNTVRLWNLSGQQLAQWTGYQGEVHYVSLRRDGRSLAIVGKDNTIQIWRVDEGLAQLLLRGCNWLNDYFTTHPQDLEKLKVCQKR
jgi:WD40 repeat protein